MAYTWNTKSALVAFITTSVALAAAGNGLVALLKTPASGQTLSIPAVWEWVENVVGYVWLGLFACMGIASWLAFKARNQHAIRDGWLIIGLLVVCLLYPVYTFGLQAVPGLIANTAVLCLALVVAIMVWKSSHAAAVALAPVVAWITLATVYVAKLIDLNLGCP